MAFGGVMRKKWGLALFLCLWALTMYATARHFFDIGKYEFIVNRFANPHVVQSIKVAIVPICNDYPCPDDVPGKLKTTFFKDSRGVREFIETASEGRIAVDGTVTPWLYPTAHFASAREFTRHRNELIKQASKYIDIEDYDIFYLYSRAKGGGLQMGLKNGGEIPTSEGKRSVHVAIMINSLIADKTEEEQPGSVILPSNSWAHELIHILGITGHANSLRCKDNRNITDCDLKAYGDSFSTMGEAAFFLTPNWSMKRDLGWVESQDINTVSKDGIYEIDQLDKDKPKALEIILPRTITLKPKVVFDRLWVEQKYPNKFDRILDRLDGGHFLARYSKKSSFPKEGAFLYFGYENHKTNTTVLIDTNPNSDGIKSCGIKWRGNPGENADALLTSSEPFSVFNTGVTITVLEKNEHNLKIKIDGLSH